MGVITGMEENDGLSATTVYVPSRGDWGFLHVCKNGTGYFTTSVSVPSRAEWGFLLIGFRCLAAYAVLFPYPPEVTGGSNMLGLNMKASLLARFRPLPR